MRILDWFYWGGIGLLLGIGFVWPVLWWCGLLGVMLFVALLSRYKRGKKLFIGLCFAWLLKYLLALLWFWSTYPIEWLPLQSSFWQVSLIGVYWITAAFWLSLGAGLVVGGWWVINRYLPTLPYIYKLCVLPILWVWAEILSSFLFSLFTLGTGGSLNVKFSFGYVGYLFANQQLFLQLAEWGGVYVLSLSFVFLAILFVVVWQRVYGKVAVGVALVLIFGTQGSVPTTPEPTQNHHLVAAIDTDFGPQSLQSGESNTQAVALADAVSAAIAEETAYILLPEDARFITNGTSVRSQLTQAMQRVVEERSVVLIDSGQVWRGDDSVMQATVYDGQSKTVEIVDKRYLVPQGEYTPWLYKSALRLFGQSQIISYIENSRGYSVGTNVRQSRLSSNVPGILFCFESVDPNGIRTIKAEHQDAPFVAHVISHAWFHEPAQLWRQLDTMLRVQAVWSDTYIVSAGNKTTGALYTPAGTVERQQPVATGEGWQVRLVQIPY